MAKLRVAGKLSILLLGLMLAACYIPDKFRSELRISKWGDYAITFDGDLMFAPMLHEMSKTKLTKEQLAERNENIRKDLSRDPAVKEITPVGDSRFHVKYERMGRLGQTQLVALLRRDARLIAMKSNEKDIIVIHANAVKPSDAEALARFNVGMEGEFRIVTDAQVLQHNATEVRPYGEYQVFIWKIENPLSPAPTLVIRREMDPMRPLSPVNQ